MAAPEDVGWEVCQQCAADGGIGIRLPSGGSCWAHADDEDLQAALRQLGEDGRLDARGVTITSELLARTLDAAPHDDTRGHPVLTDARFDRATFQGDAGFEGAAFEGCASFSRDPPIR
jgi:hypothetical protein